MRNGSAGWGSYARVLGMLLATFLMGGEALASTAPPHEYYLLSPEPLTGSLSVMSLETNNTITFGGYQVTLQQYERSSIPASAFTSGTKFTGTGFFTLGSNENAADLLAPDDFAGTAFVVPHVVGSHRYYILSPSGLAQVTIRIGAITYTLTANAGVVNEFDAGTTNGLAGRITSTAPIVVAHVATSGGVRDAYPVPPSATELLGVRSQSTVVAALTDGTSVSVYASDGSSASYGLNAGEQVTVGVGSSASQGQGSALRVVANAPVAAVQYDDGDGSDATAYFSPSDLGRRQGLPIDAQYLAVVCDQPSVTVTLYRGANEPQVQSCSGSSTTPGKAYFGTNTSGANLTAGWYLISSAPVYAMYEAATSEDEHNVLGLTPVTGPTSPTLNAIPSTTTSNPQAVSGTAGANQTVRLYVNGLLQSATTANGSGAYTFNAALQDGLNTLYTTAVVSGNESDPSNAVSTTYTNTIPRSQSGTITGNVVWTPGSPAQAYTITAADLTIAAGAQLTLQQGTRIEFGSGRRLVINGTLRVNGTTTSNALFTSNLASPTKGSWVGIVVAAGANVTINNALIEWASTAIDAASGTSFTLSTSTIRNFSGNGIVFNGVSTATITSSTIDNLTDTGTCVYMAGAATPTIRSSVIANCNYGFYLAGSGAAGPQPVVSTNNQIISHGSYSIYTTGYPANSNLLLNFTNNWWATTDPGAIGNTIYDFSDSPTAATQPTVNFGTMLSSANGAPVAGNYVTGALAAASTTLSTGAVYDVLGVLAVPTGKALVIEPGATLRFYSGGQLRVSGTLQVGGSGVLTTLTSGKAVPTRGSWTGMVIAAGASVTINNTVIEWASTGIDAASGANFTLSTSTIRNFNGNGVVFNGASTATITGSTIDNLNDTGTCVYMAGAATPTIQSSVIANCSYGFYLAGSGAAGPQPVVSTNNQIISLGSYSVYTTGYPANSYLLLNFIGNWWGTNDPGAISGTIYDFTDSPTSTTMPSVNFGNLLSAANGAPISGNYVTGPLSAASTTFIAGTTYDVLGVLAVPTGKTLVIEPGATVRFYTNGQLRVNGTLQVGGSGAQTVLTTGKATPTRGSWAGVVVAVGANITINNVLIEWASTGIDAASGANFTLSNSTIRNFNGNGVTFNGASTATITGSTIDNLNDTGTCVYMSGAATPTIQSSVIANCSYGFYLTGSPQPLVSASNQIISHGSYSVFTTGYPANSYLTLNFTGNWWGTTDLGVISNTIYDFSDSPTSTTQPAVNFGIPLNAANGTSIPGNYVTGALTAASTTFTTGTTYDVLGTLAVLTSKTLVIEPGATVRFYSNGQLRVSGTVQIGGNGLQAMLTTGKTPATRGSWTGVVVSAGASVTITNALIEWATVGIDAANGANFALNNSTIRNFSSQGVLFNGASTATITGSTIDNLNDAGYCINMVGAASPVIQSSVIANCSFGFYLSGSGGAGPQPVVSANNQILSHGSWAIYTSGYPANSNVLLNFTGNWWGTTDAGAISNTIYDFTDTPTSTTLPSVNFGNLLDGANGTPIPGNYVLGALTAVSTTFAAGTTYDVLGALAVPTGKTLIIEPGTTLRFYAGGQLRVTGTLQLGGSGALTTLTSGKATPTRGSWTGVVISAGANVTINNALIEWAATGIDAASGASFALNNSTIRNFSNTGVYFNGASTATITGSTIDNLNDAGYCISMIGAASPTVQGSVIANCLYGIYLSGSGGAGPQPIMSANNQILSHGGNSVYTGNYPANSNVQLNFTGNWWGTTDPGTISNAIYDFTDAPTSTTLPSVNFGNLQNAANGTQLLGNYVLGALTAVNTTFSAGTTYEVLGVLSVPTGKTLIIEPGAVLRFYTSGQLRVTGTLQVGGSGALTSLTSGKATPTRGSWTGVVITAGASVTINNALIEWAITGIDSASGANFTLNNSAIRNFTNYGVSFGGASTATITGSTIDNLNDAAHCVYMQGAATPTIQGSVIANCMYGVYLSGSGGAGPQPIVSANNQILSHGSLSVYTNNYPANSNVLVNFTGNWWGTTDPGAISNTIYDFTDVPTSTTMPSVNFGNLLSAANGTPIPGNYVVGALTAASTTFTAGTTYDVLGTLLVPTGKTLNVASGATLRFYSSTARLLVDGTLTIQGTPEARVKLISGFVDPSKGSWYGIEVRSTATNVLVDNAIVEWAYTAIKVTNAAATIRNSNLRNFQNAGVEMANTSSTSQITNNYIDNYNRTGYGISLSAASPAISGNQIYGTGYGIYMQGSSNPAVTGNAISNNQYGIYMTGGGGSSASAVPNPVINGNDIFGNVTSQAELNYYAANNPVVVNGRGNWWGTPTPQAGQQIRFTAGSVPSQFDFSGPATGPLTGPIAGNIVLSEYYFSPNSDGAKDSTTISGSLSQSANWTVTIRDPGNIAVRNFSGSGTAISAVWDGRNSSGNVQPDAMYVAEVSTGASATLVGSRSFALDNTPPVTGITNPTDSALLRNSLTVDVIGSARDRYFVNYALEYGAGEAPSSWTNIKSQTTAVDQGSLGSWIVNTINGSVALPNGPYALRLRTLDKAGNTASAQVPLTLDNLSIVGVMPNVQVLQTNGQLDLNFTLGGPGTASLRLYRDGSSTLLREITQNFSSGGVKTMSWDGRDAAGVRVEDEAYTYVLYATDGTRAAVYDPPAPAGDGAGSGNVDSAFNAAKNDFWKMDYTMSANGRVRMQVSGCTSTTVYPYNWKPLPAGTTQLIWDGRDANGQLATGTCSIYFDPPQPMKPNTIFVRGNTPRIFGTGASPNIEVKSNPYRIAHSYEQISKITYRIDQDAYVTVKLLPPGVSDPNDPAAIALVTNEFQAALSGGQPADHIVEWKGYQTTDTNNIAVSAEGAYTFAIIAVSAATQVSTTYRGALQLWQ